MAQLKNSRLFVSPGLGYDINADSSAIEAVDPESRPVLQFARDEGGLVGWMGTYQKSGEVFLCGDPCATVSEKEALPVLDRQRGSSGTPAISTLVRASAELTGGDAA